MNYKYLIGSILCVGTSLLGLHIYKKEKNNKRNYKEKIKYLLIEKGDLNKDPHKRNIDDNVINEFVNIANDLNIKLNDFIDDKTFDSLYKKYIEKIINNYSKT
jgi:hypothetical protein